MSSTNDNKATHYFFEEVYHGDTIEMECRKVGSIQNEKGEYEVIYSGKKEFKPFFAALLQNDELSKVRATATRLENTFNDRELFVLNEVILERPGHKDYQLNRLEKEQLFVRSGLLLPGTYAPPMQWITAYMNDDMETCDKILSQYQGALLPRYNLDDKIELKAVDAVGE